jgi:hypothetical protein
MHAYLRQEDALGQRGGHVQPRAAGSRAGAGDRDPAAPDRAVIGPRDSVIDGTD